MTKDRKSGPGGSDAPGPDLKLGTSDDLHTKLTGFKRKIAISTLTGPSGAVMTNLRQIVVTVEYTVGSIKRTYTLTTFISSIS